MHPSLTPLLKGRAPLHGVGLIAENGAPTIVTLTWQKRITTAYGGETTKIDFLANHPFEPFYDFFPHAEEHK